MAGSSARVGGRRGEVEKGAGKKAASVGAAAVVVMPNPLVLLNSGRSTVPSMVGNCGIVGSCMVSLPAAAWWSWMASKPFEPNRSTLEVPDKPRSLPGWSKWSSQNNFCCGKKGEAEGSIFPSWNKSGDD